MNRAEHLAWAKERALDFARRNDLRNAVASMVADLAKHESFDDEPTQVLCRVGPAEVHYGQEAIIAWINGFK